MINMKDCFDIKSNTKNIKQNIVLVLPFMATIETVRCDMNGVMLGNWNEDRYNGDNACLDYETKFRNFALENSIYDVNIKDEYIIIYQSILDSDKLIKVDFDEFMLCKEMSKDDFKLWQIGMIENVEKTWKGDKQNYDKGDLKFISDVIEKSKKENNLLKMCKELDELWEMDVGGPSVASAEYFESGKYFIHKDPDIEFEEDEFQTAVKL